MLRNPMYSVSQRYCTISTDDKNPDSKDKVFKRMRGTGDKGRWFKIFSFFRPVRCYV